ncbi:hypothetical protein FHS25_006367 [Rhizobium laguerreae]|uniref:Uncharacterized protein n=1 Tax=Rhizobium laguerreae TaxID=1076926 RepID=A0AAX2QCF3_9HYPH|nr:hypothetical protein [Rhizobium laguerreae]TCU15020.1 hypothetical protein EV131_12034 [Rhizobium laguerreae]
MRHGVDARLSGEVRRQAERQLGIEDHPVRDEERRDHRLLLVVRRLNDGDRRHFRSGARRGRNQQQRQPIAGGKVDTIDIIKLVRGFGEIGDELCRIQRAAAADRHDSVDAALAADFCCRFDNMRWRVDDHAVEHGARDAGFGNRRFRIARQPGRPHLLVGDEQHMGGLVALEELADLAGRAFPETDVGRGLESDGHVFGPFVWLSRAAGPAARPL